MIAIILLEAVKESMYTEKCLLILNIYIYIFEEEIFCLTRYVITEKLQEIFNELLKDQRQKQAKPIHRQTGNNTENYEWRYMNEVFRKRQI